MSDQNQETRESITSPEVETPATTVVTPPVELEEGQSQSQAIQGEAGGPIIVPESSGLDIKETHEFVKCQEDIISPEEAPVTPQRQAPMELEESQSQAVESKGPLVPDSDDKERRETPVEAPTSTIVGEDKDESEEGTTSSSSASSVETTSTSVEDDGPGPRSYASYWESARVTPEQLAQYEAQRQARQSGAATEKVASDKPKVDHLEAFRRLLEKEKTEAAAAAAAAAARSGLPEKRKGYVYPSLTVNREHWAAYEREWVNSEAMEEFRRKKKEEKEEEERAKAAAEKNPPKEEEEVDLIDFGSD